MSRYNHFTNPKYQPICFGDLAVGDKFRMDKWDGKRRRYSIVMIKTSDLSYKEAKSRKEYVVHSSAIDVQHYSLLNEIRL